MKRIGVLTSGGDAPGMNAAVRAVVRTAAYNGMSVIGFKRGYNGLLMRNHNMVDDFEILTERNVSGIIHRGGTFLMTGRCKEFHDEEIQRLAISNMSSLGLEGLVCVGGDGTFAGANALNNLGFPTIGVPGTIDNDLAYTDYTIGFDTAVNTVCNGVDRIRETSESHERASMITVMGRNCGEIAIHTAMSCGAEFALIPEIEWTVEEVAEKIKWGVLHGKRSTIIILAEGAFASLKSDLHALCQKYELLHSMEDEHITSSRLANVLEVLSGHEIRATVLGYIQRGGSPSSFDRILGSRLGARAVELLRDDIGGRAVGVREDRLVDVPLADTQNVVKPVDYEMLNLANILSMSKT